MYLAFHGPQTFPFSAPLGSSSDRMLMDCYLSGQMSEQQLSQHLDDDARFRGYFESEMAALHAPDAAGATRAADKPKLA